MGGRTGGGRTRTDDRTNGLTDGPRGTNIQTDGAALQRDGARSSAPKNDVLSDRQSAPGPSCPNDVGKALQDKTRKASMIHYSRSKLSAQYDTQHTVCYCLRFPLQDGASLLRGCARTDHNICSCNQSIATDVAGATVAAILVQRGRSVTKSIEDDSAPHWCLGLRPRHHRCVDLDRVSTIGSK